MNTTGNDRAAAPEGEQIQLAMPDLKWASRKTWGTVGRTHRADVEFDGQAYGFTVDQPIKGQWELRVWKNGDIVFHRMSIRTMREAKAVADALWVGITMGDWTVITKAAEQW